MSDLSKMAKKFAQKLDDKIKLRCHTCGHVCQENDNACGVCGETRLGKTPANKETCKHSHGLLEVFCTICGLRL